MEEESGWTTFLGKISHTQLISTVLPLVDPWSVKWRNFLLFVNLKFCNSVLVCQTFTTFDLDLSVDRRRLRVWFNGGVDPRSVGCKKLLVVPTLEWRLLLRTSWGPLRPTTGFKGKDREEGEFLYVWSRRVGRSSIQKNSKINGKEERETRRLSRRVLSRSSGK